MVRVNFVPYNSQTMVSHGLIDKPFLLWDVFWKITCSLRHNDVINCQSLVFFIKTDKLLSIAIDQNRQRTPISK